VYKAMREVFIAGDWKEFHRQGRLLDDLGVPRRPPTHAQQQALFAEIERFLGK